MGMTGPGSSPSTDHRQDDAERWVQWQWPTWHLVHEIECNGDLVICRCGMYCYRHEQRLVAFTGVDPAQGRCSECESR